MKLSLHLILIHIHVLEHFIQDNFVPWEFGGWGGGVQSLCSESVSMSEDAVKLFFFFPKLESFCFHSATEGYTLSRRGAFAHQKCLHLHLLPFQNIISLLRGAVKCSFAFLLPQWSCQTFLTHRCIRAYFLWKIWHERKKPTSQMCKRKKSDKLVADRRRLESRRAFKLEWTADELSELRQSHKHTLLCVIDWGRINGCLLNILDQRRRGSHTDQDDLQGGPSARHSLFV